MGALLLALAPLIGAPQAAQEPPRLEAPYRVLVCAESADEVVQIAFDGTAASVERVHTVGSLPTEIEGPHGLGVDPSGEAWYVTLAHGLPYGNLLKMDMASGDVIGTCELGLFPATLCVSPDTGLLYCVNFDLHGDMSPSDVSIVDPEEMVEVGRTVVGAMPHGSRLAPGGDRLFVCSMMDGTLVELDGLRFEVRRSLSLEPRPSAAELAAQLEAKRAAEAAGRPVPVGPDHDHTGRLPRRTGRTDGPEEASAPEHGITKPTWAAPSPVAPFVYVCLNGAAEVVEVDTLRWAVTRRFATGKAPYNADVTADGKTLVVTYKGAQQIGVWDLASGTERARIEASAPVPHGVVTSPDSKYAFVSNENRGSAPGTLDVIDLRSGKLVATAPVGLQAGGIALLPRRN